MENVTKIFVGVDVSKDTLAVHILPLKKSIVFKNNDKGVKQLIKELVPWTVGQVVCEATGGYETRMIKALKAKGYTTWVVEPRRIKAFICSYGVKSKTDKIDASMIARFASQMTNEDSQYARHDKLHELVNRKAVLTKMMTEEKNRLQNPEENYKQQIKQHIKFMQKQIDSLNADIDQIVTDDASLSHKMSTLQSVPGVGAVTASVLIAEVPELGHLPNKKIAALVGVAPYTRESGLFKGKSMTSGGRKAPRAALFMAALVAAHHNAKFKLFYERLVKLGKPKKVALVAVMRKLLITLNTMLRNGTVWNENIA